MKKLLVAVAALVSLVLIAFGVFAHRLDDAVDAESAVLVKRLEELDVAALKDAALEPLDCADMANARLRPERRLFGTPSVVVAVDGEDGLRLVKPLRLSADSLRATEEDGFVHTAKDLLEVPPGDWLSLLEHPAIHGFSVAQTDLFVGVADGSDGLHVEVREYATGAVVCRGTLDVPTERFTDFHKLVEAALTRRE